MDGELFRNASLPGIVGDQVKYNELTKKLLAEGYTINNYPRDIVKLPNGYLSKENPLDNFSGGFEYLRIYADSIIYRTGCGMSVLGKNVINSMGYMGTEWCHENDNPVIRCPFDKDKCPQNDERLHTMFGGGLCIQCWCVCHSTDKPYDYEHSFEKAEKERKEEKEKKYQEYSDAHKGRICKRHMYFDERTRMWALHYEPRECASICYSQNGYCPILGRQLNRKRGNVYYDVKTSVVPDMRGKQISMFDKEKIVSVTKGIRFFEKPCSIDICEAFVRINAADEISYHYRINHSFEKLINPTWKFEILNIRAEQRESRDLMQDLQDIRDGILITHASDDEKKQKEEKKKRRQQAKDKKITAMEKKIMEIGYENLDLYEQNKACGLLTMDRIDELEAERQEKMKKEQDKPVQLSLFDMI